MDEAPAEDSRYLKNMAHFVTNKEFG